MNIRFGFAWLVPALFIILYLSFRARGWLGKSIGLTASLALFAFALAGMWASGHTQSTAISGLIPMYDAETYYVDALRLLAGRDVSGFSASRPLFAGLLAVLLAITGRNLLITISVLTLITGMACYFTAREIQRSHGVLPAVFLLIFLFLYYRYRSVGTVMSENLGFALGVLGGGLIWRGITNRSYRLALYGLFITTWGLNARPGALFILPALILWGSRHFREHGRHLSRRFFLLGVGVVGAGFVLNSLMARLIGPSYGVPFSQLSYALYGTASGGNSWAYVLEVHPELLELSEPGMTQTVYKLTFELIRHQPSLFLQGALYNWQMLFSNTWYNVFSYFGGENTLANTLARWGLYLLCILGFAKWMRKADPYAGFIIAATLGIFISVPFVPPSDAYGMRLYAASAIILGLLPALGLTNVTEYLKINFLSRPYANGVDSTAVVWYSAALVLLLLVGPLLVRGTSYLPPFTRPSCQPEKSSILIRFDPGSFISVIPEKSLALDWVPVFHRGIFKRNAHSLPDMYLAEWLETVEPPVNLFYTLDYISNGSVLVLIPTPLVPQSSATMELCGEWINDPFLTQYSIFISDDSKAIHH